MGAPEAIRRWGGLPTLRRIKAVLHLDIEAVQVRILQVIREARPLRVPVHQVDRLIAPAAVAVLTPAAVVVALTPAVAAVVVAPTPAVVVEAEAAEADRTSNTSGSQAKGAAA